MSEANGQTPSDDELWDMCKRASSGGVQKDDSEMISSLLRAKGEAIPNFEKIMERKREASAAQAAEKSKGDDAPQAALPEAADPIKTADDPTSPETGEKEAAGLAPRVSSHRIENRNVTERYEIAFQDVREMLGGMVTHAEHLHGEEAKRSDTLLKLYVEANRPSRLVPWVAASWLMGLAVGVGLCFAFMQRTEPQPTASTGGTPLGRALASNFYDSSPNVELDADRSQVIKVLRWYRLHFMPEAQLSDYARSTQGDSHRTMELSDEEKAAFDALVKSLEKSMTVKDKP
jgi:hypothetical protein